VFYCEKLGVENRGEKLYCVKSGVCFFPENLMKSVKSGNRGRRGFLGRIGFSGSGWRSMKKWGWEILGMGKKWDGKMYRRARNVSYPEY